MIFFHQWSTRKQSWTDLYRAFEFLLARIETFVYGDFSQLNFLLSLEHSL